MCPIFFGGFIPFPIPLRFFEVPCGTCLLEEGLYINGLRYS